LQGLKHFNKIIRRPGRLSSLHWDIPIVIFLGSKSIIEHISYMILEAPNATATEKELQHKNEILKLQRQVNDLTKANSSLERRRLDAETAGDMTSDCFRASSAASDCRVSGWLRRLVKVERLSAVICKSFGGSCKTVLGTEYAYLFVFGCR
jgi:hypothetical protein